MSSHHHHHHCWSSKTMAMAFLYCQEPNCELEESQQDHNCELTDQEWLEVLTSLQSKDHTPSFFSGAGAGDYLLSARSAAVAWVADAAGRHSFSPLTAILAVNYLDRCFLPSTTTANTVLRLQADKPWMARLAAVAALSLAAKVEETRVPLILDLQSSPAASPAPEFLFDCRTVRRMELLVLSALGWRMSPVTPMSFVHHLVLRLGGGGGGRGGADMVVRRCEAALMAVVGDCRYVRHSAASWAAAALLFVAAGGGDGGELEYCETERLVALLDAPLESVEECYQMIVSSMCCGTSVTGHKRKHSYSSVLDYQCCSPGSPAAVIGSCFSCDSSSNDGLESWAMPEMRPLKMRNCIANEALSGEGEGIGDDNYDDFIANI